MLVATCSGFGGSIFVVAVAAAEVSVAAAVVVAAGAVAAGAATVSVGGAFVFQYSNLPEKVYRIFVKDANGSIYMNFP